MGKIVIWLALPYRQDLFQAIVMINREGYGGFMKKGLIIIIFVLFFAGCSTESIFIEVELKDEKKDVRTFFESVEDQNGALLYFDKDKVAYVMLNGKNVIQGEKVLYFTDFSVDSDGETIDIHYREEEAGNYADDSLKHQVVYKINKIKQENEIRIFKNGNEVSFEVVSGN